MILPRTRSILAVYSCLLAPVAFIGIIHIIGGAAVLYAPQAVDVTQLAGVVMLVGRDPLLIGLGLIAVGAMAITARVGHRAPWAETLLVGPQQIVLLVQLIGVIPVAWAGVFPDGYAPVPGDRGASAAFIIGDQAALLVLCLSHAVEMVWMRTIPTLIQYENRAAEHDMMVETLRIYRELERWRQTGKPFREESLRRTVANTSPFARPHKSVPRSARSKSRPRRCARPFAAKSGCS